jgi:hypothetical protein
MIGASTRRERFLPYAYDRNALALEVIGCVRDDEPLLGFEARTLELIGPWRRAEIEVGVTMPADLVSRLVPTAERRDPPVAVLVGLRCEATRLRRGEVLTIAEHRARGTFVVRRDELAGTAEIHAWLVRTRPHLRRAAGFALAAGARLAHAPGWTLVLDRERSTTARGLDVQFKSFAADASIPVDERGNLYRLDSAQDEPILWLNLDHARIAEVLRSDGTRGRVARQRDVVFDRIIAGVRMQLVMRAALHACADGPVYAWERAVLADILPRLYPQVPAADRLARLGADVVEPADLIGRLDDVLQAGERTAHAVSALLEDG